jgi:hypothetical protein
MEDGPHERIDSNARERRGARPRAVNFPAPESIPSLDEINIVYALFFCCQGASGRNWSSIEVVIRL